MTIAFCAVALVSGCSLPPLATWPETPPTATPQVEIGTASWYGPGFHGSPTSSGEIYDQHGLTAAHPTLPLGAWVLVTNLENGRSVEVRINDRGPFVEGRIIDLSYTAARMLDLVGPGTARVRIDRIDDGSVAGSVVHYAAQAAAFRDGALALSLKDELTTEFPDVYVAPVRTASSLFYRVRVGPYADRDHALAQRKRLDRQGLRAIVVEEPLP